MMKTLRRVEVEPLSDQRWAKIEEAVFARLEHAENGSAVRPLPRRPSGLTWGLIAAAFAALVAVVLVIRGLPGDSVMDSPSRIATGW